MERFIDPKTLARVKDMPLVAKTIADGFLHGHHESVQRGVGIEFSQYRPYEDGDDLSRIDWKLFARSDRYYVREAERESEVAIWFVLDASASMGIGSTNENSKENWSKLNYAAHLIATLSYLAYRQGDNIGFMAISSDKQNTIPLGSGERHWSAILREMSRVKSGSTFPSQAVIKNTITNLQQSGVVFMVSDFFEHQGELLDFTKRISAGKAKVSAIQVISEDEISFPYSGAIRFEDAETKEEVLVSAGSAKDVYFKAREGHQKQLRRSLSKQSVDLSTINIDDPMDQAIFDFVKNRARVMR